MMCFLRLLFFFCCFTATALGQPYAFRHYQVENGLSNNSVFCSVQDKQGFMWFGTKHGLNRFDGYRFKLFTVNGEDENNLSREVFYALAVDKKGVLWAGSQKGLFWFDAQAEKLVPFLDSLRDVNHLLFDNRGQLWALSGLTVYRYNFETKQLTRFAPETYFSASALCQLPDGRLCFSTSEGFLVLFNPLTNEVKKADLFAHSPRPASRWIAKLLTGTNNTVYVGTCNQGLKAFDVAAFTYKDLLIANPDKTSIYVRDMMASAENEYWMATESGVFVYNSQSGNFTQLKKKFLDAYSLSDNAVYTLCKDAEGGIWAGTYFGGLNYYPKQAFSFQKFYPDYTQNSISGNAVREICEDDFGNLWIGTEDAGLNKLNPQTGAVRHFEPTGSAQSISYYNIHGLLPDKDKLWIGTFEHGLDVMNIASGNVIKHYAAGSGTHELKSNFIVSLLKTRSGDIYAGSSSSLYKYLPERDGFEQITGVADRQFVSCLLEDKEGTIWMGTHGYGVYYFNPATGERGRFQNNPADKNSLPADVINALCLDAQNNVWIATEGGGLCRLNAGKKTFTRYTIANGMPSNFVFKVLEDAQKAIWATTSKGLVKLDVAKNKTTVFTKAAGLLNDQFNYNSGYKDAGGKLYFGSVLGMIAFDPSGFYNRHFTPPVYITGLQVAGREVEAGRDSGILKRSLLFTDALTLAHDQSTFSLDFSALSFTSPEVTEYRYKMAELDKDWTYLKTNRKVYFTNLEPGHYTFLLNAATGGNWEGPSKQLTIHIRPPLWATGWAKGLYALLFAALLFYLVRSYHSIQVAKKEKAIYKAKIDFFTNIAHEIRTPLTLIKGPVENLHDLMNGLPEIKDDVSMMERNTARLVNLVNQILDFRQAETKGFQLDFKRVNLCELMEENFRLFEPAARKRKLSFSLSLPPQAIHLMADDEALNKVFSNLFSNAVKYAATQVQVRLLAPEKKEGYIVTEIENDGRPIPPHLKEKIFEPFFRLKETAKEKGTGIGLALARSLTQLHGGRLFVSTGMRDVNTFILQLPYSPSADTRNAVAEAALQK